MMDLNLDGLIPATALPMHENGDPDEGALRTYIKWVADQGPVALAINVDTGETAHLTHKERLRVLEVVKEEVDLPCVVGLPGPSTRQAERYARDFKSAGADALLMFPIPAYLSSPLDPEIPLLYHRTIASVGLPMILFQLQPALGGVLYDADLIRKLAQIDNVIAIKEASFDARRFMDVAHTLASLDRTVTLLTGNDNFIFESLLLGATGALIGFGAIMTKQQVEMIAAWQANHISESRDLAKPIQLLSDVVFAEPVGQYRARLKECLVMLGVLEHAHVRLPLLPINDDDRSKLHQTLHDVGLL